MAHQPKILLVDDEPMNIVLVQAMLEGENYDIQSAADGKQALSHALQHLPDLILLDVMMPGMDGYEVTARLKKDPQMQHVPIILITALNRAEDKVRGLEVGADDFLSKPLDRSELKARVNSLLKVKAFHDHLMNYQQVLEAEVKRRTTEVREELRRRKIAEAQLIQAQKMEAIGTLAGGIAHDFNNILSSIIGFTELSLMEMKDDIPVRENLEQVLAAGSRARNLVQQILAFSRQAEQKVTPVDVRPIVKETLKLLRATLPATVEIQQLLVGSYRVKADPTMIHQVLMNLCTNAAHAMEDGGGVLKVFLEDVELESDVTDRQADVAPGKYLKLTVSDTGCGIAPEIRDRVFDPFFTTKEKGKGTGIGLSAVHGIVQAHGGFIQMESLSGKGSIFEVFLPRIETTDDIVEEYEPSIPTGDETILFIDDEQSIVVMARNLLEGLGYRVIADSNWQKALDLFKAQPHQIDLVITDMTMPHMTGTALAEKMLQARPDIPIILCTGYNAKLSEKELSEIGIQALVTKPFLRYQIASAIRKTLDQVRTDQNTGLGDAA